MFGFLPEEKPSTPTSSRTPSAFKVSSLIDSLFGTKPTVLKSYLAKFSFGILGTSSAGTSELSFN
jgi:hypothetical protein